MLEAHNPAGVSKRLGHAEGWQRAESTAGHGPLLGLSLYLSEIQAFANAPTYPAYPVKKKKSVYLPFFNPVKH